MRRLYLAFLLGLGLAACAKEKEAVDTSETKPLETVVEEIFTIGTNAKEKSMIISGKQYLFLVAPIEAGQSSVINVYEGSRSESDDPIEKIILYEDGRNIAECDGTSFNQIVMHLDPSSHTYNAELYTESGLVIETDPIEVTFTGKKIDFIPYIPHFMSSAGEAGKATNIFVQAKDIGDNKGIKRIILYEDGKPIHTIEGINGLHKKLEYNEPQTHEYYAEVEDIGGNITTTDTVKISFTGQAFPPEIGTWFIDYDTEKNITTILVRGRDKRNVRDDAGIQKIVLFENGIPIDSTEEGTLLTKLSRATGTHTYFAEITNNSGLIARTGVDSVGYVSTR